MRACSAWHHETFQQRSTNSQQLSGCAPQLQSTTPTALLWLSSCSSHRSRCRMPGVNRLTYGSMHVAAGAQKSENEPFGCMHQLHTPPPPPSSQTPAKAGVASVPCSMQPANGAKSSSWCFPSPLLISNRGHAARKGLMPLLIAKAPISSGSCTFCQSAFVLVQGSYSPR